MTADNLKTIRYINPLEKIGNNLADSFQSCFLIIRLTRLSCKRQTGSSTILIKAGKCTPEATTSALMRSLTELSSRPLSPTFIPTGTRWPSSETSPSSSCRKNLNSAMVHKCFYFHLKTQQYPWFFFWLTSLVNNSLVNVSLYHTAVKLKYPRKFPNLINFSPLWNFHNYEMVIFISTIYKLIFF